MPPLFLPVTCLVAIALGAFILFLVRTKTDGEDAGIPLLGAIALVGGMTGLVMQAAGAYFPMLNDYGEGLPWWLDAPLQGIILGPMVYLAFRLWNGVTRIVLWACHRPNEDETSRFWLRRHIYSVAAVVIVFTALMAVERLARGSDEVFSVLEWLMVLAVLSALPLYHAWVLPWFTYYRARQLDRREHGEIHEWLEHVRSTHDVPKFHLRVQDGKMINALATGGVRAYFIVLGRGLLEHLQPQHVKAVLAHEIGHVVNGDTSRRTVPLVLCSTALHLLYFHFVVQQMDSVWQEMVCVAIGAPFFWFILPGLFQRRWEYQADRKAVEIMGDAEIVGQTLERIYDANNIHINAPGWPHPPLRDRLKAIGVEATQESEAADPVRAFHPMEAPPPKGAARPLRSNEGEARQGHLGLRRSLYRKKEQ